MFSLFEVYILLVFITTLDFIVHVSLEKIMRKKKLTQVVVLWSSDSLDLKVGKDKHFMIEYNQTLSEIHINEILHVLIMPHVLMGHVCSS